ncbi:hypothetical protein AB1Y20_015603 [Prymnesium parvum]|uniref:V-SNARE coiled-coil homology domain-containing protein n=1 Tax=Prymnesium parvum TaxID=97485 RepID=A0AB34K0P1_PRYPA
MEDPNKQGILWAAVTRDSTTLAEAGQDTHGGAVLALAKKILAKKPSPGWEFERAGNLRACKFHVHEPGKVWAVCCVYAPGNIPEIQAKGFLEKIILLTEPLRETPAWQNGPTLVAQDSFAPTLLQRMQQANSGGKLAMVSKQVGEVKELMNSNIELLLENHHKLDELDEKASVMNRMASQFQKRSMQARKFQMWQQAKFGMATGTAVTVGVAVVTVPPLVAVMGPGGWAVGGAAALGTGAAVGYRMGR